jgi:hypothetical protein
MKYLKPLLICIPLGTAIVLFIHLFFGALGDEAGMLIAVCVMVWGFHHERKRNPLDSWRDQNSN